MHYIDYPSKNKIQTFHHYAHARGSRPNSRLPRGRTPTQWVSILTIRDGSPEREAQERESLRANLSMVTQSCGSAVTNHIKSFGLGRRHSIKTDLIKNILKLRHSDHIRPED